MWTWIKGIERRIVPQAVWDWYYDLAYWPRNFVNWVVVHGGVTALAVLVGAIMGGNVGALVGYGVGVAFYAVKEATSWIAGGTKWPSVDQLGDFGGPVVVGGLMLWLLT